MASAQAACALCQPTVFPLLWQDEHCRVVCLQDADYPAYCRVEWLSHVAEMTDLAPTARAHLMKVVFAVESALREVIQPDKINLASLGNKTPHLHWHVLPRFVDDKHFPNSHWGAPCRAGQARPLDAATLARLQHTLQARIQCALQNPSNTHDD